MDGERKVMQSCLDQLFGLFLGFLMPLLVGIPLLSTVFTLISAAIFNHDM